MLDLINYPRFFTTYIFLRKKRSFSNHTAMMPFIEIAKSAKKLLWATVGSLWHDLTAKVWSEVTSDATQRKQLINGITNFLEKYEFNGVFTLWKAPGCPVSWKSFSCADAHFKTSSLIVKGQRVRSSIHEGQKWRNFLL